MKSYNGTLEIEVEIIRKMDSYSPNGDFIALSSAFSAIIYLTQRIASKIAYLLIKILNDSCILIEMMRKCVLIPMDEVNMDDATPIQTELEIKKMAASLETSDTESCCPETATEK